MYSALLAMQYAGILILLGEIICVLRRKTTKLQMILLMVLVSTLINFVGYLLEMQAVTQELALQAVKIIYIGKPFIILFILIFFLERMGIKPPKFLYPTLGILHTAVSALVFTCDRHTLFYSSIGYDTEHGLFPHLVLGHSAFYILYHVIIISYFVFMFAVGIGRLRHTKSRRERMQIAYLTIISVVSVLGLFVFFTGLSGGYDTTIPAYLIATLLLLVLILKYDLLDTLSLVKENVMDEFAEGLLVIDQEEKMLYANEKVQTIFPDLKRGESESAREQLHQLCLADQKLLFGNNIYEIYEKEIVKNGRLYGRMFVVRDVTESCNHAAELQKQTEIARRANQAKSDFLAKMSHEIRTPINAVLGMNEMILRESGEEEIRRYAVDVQNSANALLGIINDILDISKIESGKMEIIPEQYELDSLLNDLISMIYVKAKAKNLELEVEVDETLPNGLKGDDIRIRQVLVNLLNNAVKYTEKGRVSLHVKGTQEGESLLLHFAIEDTGIGIREEDLPRLFAKFERIEESKNRSIEGTGLGMNIVFELLKMMGTELKVSSIYGQGSVFSFDLRQEIYDREPIGNLAQRSRELHNASAYKASFTAAEASVLLVDDNDVNRKVFCNLLKETKIKIDDVDSSFACLEKIRQKRYELIFMDHMMPDMDGVETLRRMAETDHLCKDVPVIILTANAIAGAKEHYLKEGFTDYLSKPINSQKLENLLLKYLPDTMVQGADTPRGENPPASLPELEEFDWDYAGRYFADEKLLKQTVRDIYVSMDSDRAKLQGWYDLFTEGTSSEEAEAALENYRIMVHAIKSNMAMIGALLLSKLARVLEVAALQKNISRIRLVHPVFLEEFSAHQRRMALLVEEEKQACDMHETAGLLALLKYGLEEMNYDTADSVMEKLNACRYEGKIKAKMDTLSLQILNLQTDEALQTLEEIRQTLEDK